MKARVLVAVLAGVVALGFGVAPGPAGAQEGEAEITVQQRHPSTSSIHYVVQVTDAEGEPMDGATVTATATGPDGAAGAPVTLSPGTDGTYQGNVELSETGTWTVVFESTNPTASLERTEEMPAESSGSEDDDGGGSNVIVLVLVIVFLAVVAAIAGWIWFTRQRQLEDDPVGPPTEPR